MYWIFIVFERQPLSEIYVMTSIIIIIFVIIKKYRATKINQNHNNYIIIPLH